MNKIEDREFNNSMHRYPALRKIVIEELGDALRNLSEKRKEKIIQRSVVIYIKAANLAVGQALEVINDRIEQKEKGAADDWETEVKGI